MGHEQCLAPLKSSRWDARDPYKRGTVSGVCSFLYKETPVLPSGIEAPAKLI